MRLKELMKRYGINSRQTMYNRLKGLGLELQKDADGSNYAAPEQVELLDEFNAHLKAAPGNTIANFTPRAKNGYQPAVGAEPRREAIVTSEAQLIDTDAILSQQVAMEQLLGILVEHINPRTPLWRHRELLEAQTHKLPLTRSDIHQLVGVRPPSGKHVQEWLYDGWLFKRLDWKKPKALWMVAGKITDNELTSER